MELYEEVLIKALSQQRMEVTFPDLRLDAQALVGEKCYRALEEIRDIIRDRSLTDPECYQKIEAIIRALEEVGSSGGVRHDWG